MTGALVAAAVASAVMIKSNAVSKVSLQQSKIVVVKEIVKGRADKPHERREYPLMFVPPVLQTADGVKNLTRKRVKNDVPLDDGTRTEIKTRR